MTHVTCKLTAKESGSALESYAQQSCLGYLYLYPCFRDSSLVEPELASFHLGFIPPAVWEENLWILVALVYLYIRMCVCGIFVRCLICVKKCENVCSVTATTTWSGSVWIHLCVSSSQTDMNCGMLDWK